MKKILFLLLVIQAICIQIANAKLNDSTTFKVGVLPSVFYTPETKLGFGGLVYTYFKVNRKDTICKPSNSQSYISYTINKQFAFENDCQIWTHKNQLMLLGSASYSRFPQFFYGMGNNTKLGDRVNISFDNILFQTKILKKIKGKIYSGLILNYQKVYNQNIKIVPKNMCSEIFGNMGFTSKGIGLLLMIDERNNSLNPSKGYYVESSFTDFSKVISNENMFTSIVFDVRKYATIRKRIIWNGNIYSSFNKGNVPYRMMAEIGGARFLRGYYKGRFRDNNMIVVQQELRMNVYKAFGMTVFGGIGEVANTLSQFKTNTIHYDYGVGLRIRTSKKQNTNIRIDYGITKDSNGLYVVFAEAF